MTRQSLKQRRVWFWGIAFAVLLAGGTAMTISTKADVAKSTDDAAVEAVLNKSAPVQPAPPEAIESAQDLSVAFRRASEMVLPSVVAIETSAKATASQPDINPEDLLPFGDLDRFKGTPFEDFFNDDSLRRHFQFRGTPMPPQARPRGIGSGVVINRSGLILTNNHVVAGDGEVTVRLHDGREFKAVEVKTDPKTDLAIVRIEGASNLVAAPLGDSDQMQIGDWVLALGQPFGLESTVTAGIISGKHRGIGITDRENFLQTDAAINPGNSGGPLINLAGQVIGINTAIHSRGGGNDGIGFAVPSNLAKWVTDQLVEHGKVKRAFLGVGIQMLDHKLAEQLDVQPRHGVVVTQVHTGTPAEEAGLRAGDVIIALNGKEVRSPRELQVLVERTELGKPQSLTVFRDGKELTVDFTPDALPEKFVASVKNSRQPSGTPLGETGLELDTLTPEVAKRLGMEGVKGVVITSVKSGSAADKAGLESGMVVTQVNRKAVTDVEEVKKMIDKESLSKGLLLLVRTSEGSRFVVLQ